jgi:hypothetical protein
MFFSKNPAVRSRPWSTCSSAEDEPGRLRMLAALFKNPGNVFVELSAPIDLRRFIGRPDIAEHSVRISRQSCAADLLKSAGTGKASPGRSSNPARELKQSSLTASGFSSSYKPMPKITGCRF